MKKTILFILFILAVITQLTAQSVSQIYSRAMEAYNDGRFVEANNLFDEFFTSYGLRDEMYSTAKFYSSEALLNSGNKDAAAVGFNYLIENFHWSNFRARSLYRLGLIYFDKSEYAESRRSLQQLLDEYPESEHIGSSLYWIGESYVEDNRMEDAILFLEEAVNDKKNNKFIDYSIFTLANIYEKIEDYESAVKYYDRLLSFHKESPLASAAQIRIGIAYFKLKDYQSSILELNNPQLTNLPKEFYSESLFLLANSYYRVQEYASAEKTYLEIVDNFPASSNIRDVQYGLAWTYFQQKKYDDAYQAFHNLSRGKDSIAMKSFYWKGEAKRYAGKHNDAFQVYREFLENYPNSGLAKNVQYQIGVLYFNDKKFENAENYLRNALNSTDRAVKAKSYSLLGEIELSKKKFEQARKAFESAINISAIPDHLHNRALLGLGIALFYLKQYKDGIMYLSEVNLRDPRFESDKVNFYLAENYFGSGNYKEALPKYNEVDAANSEVGSLAVYGRAYSYFNLKDYDNAVLAYNDFIKRYPKDSKIIDAKLRLADSYYGSKNFAASSKIYQDIFKAGKTALNNPYAQYQYAQALFKSGKFDDAINEFRSLQTKFPNSEYADKSLYIVGWIQFQQNNYSSAIANYRSVLSSYPRSSLSPVVYYSIGDAYFNIGNYDSAIVNYQKVLIDYPGSNYIFDAVNGIQYSYVAKGEPIKAINLINEFVIKNPNLSYADQLFFKKGEIYYSIRAYEEAKLSYKEFTSNFPNSKLVADAYYWIGKSAHNLNQNEEAIFNFKRVFEKYPNSESGAAAVIETGKIYGSLKQYDNAIAIYDQALDKYNRSGRYAEILFEKGSALSDKGDLSNAYEVFEEISMYHSATIFGDKARFELGLIEMAASRYANADAYFKAVAEKRTDDLGAKAQFYHGLSLFEQKKYREAITAFVRVRTIFSSYSEWLARSYLKMGDAYVELKDYNNARDIYRQLLAKHKGDEFGKEAQTKLRALK